MTKSLRPLLGLLLALALLISACGNGGDDSADATGSASAQTTTTDVEGTDEDVATEDVEAEDAETEDADAAPDADTELELEPADEATDAEPIEVSDDSVVLETEDMQETLAEFNQRFELVARSLAAQQGLELNDELRTQLISFKPEFLERRAVEVALLSEAEARGFEASDEDVQTEIDETILPTLPEGETLETFIETAGFEDEEQLRATLREDKLLQQVTEELESEIEVTDEEVEAAYEERQDEFAQPAQTCASHILLETVEDAEAVLTELEEGADFAEVAQERSTGPSAPQGGDLGCFGEGQMVAPFEEAALEAEIGEPVGPVETEFGQHVILVTERTEAGTASFEEVSEPLREQLIQERFTESLDAIRAEYDITTYPEIIVAETEAELAAAQAAAEEAAAEEGETPAEDAETPEGEAPAEESEDADAASEEAPAEDAEAVEEAVEEEVVDDAQEAEGDPEDTETEGEDTN